MRTFPFISFENVSDVNQLMKLVDVKIKIWIHYHVNPFDVNSLPEREVDSLISDLNFATKCTKCRLTPKYTLTFLNERNLVGMQILLGKAT